MTLKQNRRKLTQQFYKNNHISFFIALLQSVCFVATNLVISWLLQLLIDITSGTETDISLGMAALFCLGTIGLLVLCFFFDYHSTPKFISTAMAQYKNYVFGKLSQKGISTFSKETTSFYISALSNDATTIESDYVSCITSLFDNILMFAGALILMLIYSPLLTLIGIFLSLLPILVSLLVGGKMENAEKTVSSQNEIYMSTLHDSLSGFSVVKSFRAEAAICKLFNRQVEKVKIAKTKRKKIAIIVQGLGAISGCIAQLGVFVVGALLAMNGFGISGGTLIAFVNLMNFIINPIATVPELLARRKAAIALLDKITAALDHNIRTNGNTVKTELKKGIIIQNLSFGYEENKPILDQINCIFQAGKSYAIVGASGSGKSTLLKLLMASHNTYSGNIFYDSTELKHLSGDSLYSLITAIEQNVFIFNASIRDNITMFSNFSKEEIDTAISLSGLTELIIERGEDYLCGENGIGLSGGEKQRIAIARSLLKRSQVLLVDEATAALDNETALYISDSILGLKDMTRIVVTHTLNAKQLKEYDNIIALKNGQIIEQGRFDELMNNKSYFYSLFTVSQ